VVEQRTFISPPFLADRLDKRGPPFSASLSAEFLHLLPTQEGPSTFFPLQSFLSFIFSDEVFLGRGVFLLMAHTPLSDDVSYHDVPFSRLFLMPTFLLKENGSLFPSVGSLSPSFPLTRLGPVPVKLLLPQLNEMVVGRTLYYTLFFSDHGGCSQSPPSWLMTLFPLLPPW